MAIADHSRQVRALIYVGIGLVEWIGLSAIPGRHNANYSGAYYALALLVSAMILGFANPTTPHFEAGVLMVAPGLLLAAWTAPRGNNDGLWILWFPLLAVFIPLGAGIHWAGARIRRAVE
jgi:hypothetical protein